MIHTLFSEYWAFVCFIVVHIFFAGRISSQIGTLQIKIEKWESLFESGGFPHCKIHKHYLDVLEHRVTKLEAYHEYKNSNV